MEVMTTGKALQGGIAAIKEMHCTSFSVARERGCCSLGWLGRGLWSGFREIRGLEGGLQASLVNTLTGPGGTARRSFIQVC